MTDITEDLRLYKELELVWDKYWERYALEDLLERDSSDYPDHDDPRVGQFLEVKARIEAIALHSAAVTITDSTLHQLFHTIRLKVLNDSFDENGYLESNDLFDRIVDRYNPNDFIRNLSLTKPVASLILVPSRVVKLISETRQAFCLQLPTACISMSRSTVERVVIDIALRSGRIHQEEALGDMGMCDRISLLIDRSASKNSPLRKEINEFMKATSDVIHSNVEADMEMARKLYLECIRLTQALYGQYKNQLKK